MARGQIPFVVIDTAGNAVVGANTNITNRVTGTPATVWADETTTTNQLGNPVATDAKGRISGWLDEGAYQATISGAGITTYSTNFEVLSGRGTSLVAPNAVGASQIQGLAVQPGSLAASVTSTLLPAGLVLPFAGNAAPGGWVMCDGATYNGTLAQYTPLWNALGTTYGGTGQSAFKVPDLRGRSPVGAQSMGTDGTNGVVAITAGDNTRVHVNRGGAGGEEKHTALIAELIQHSHGPGTLSTDTTGWHSHTGDLNGFPGAYVGGGGGQMAIWPSHDAGTVVGVDWFGTKGAGDHSHSVNTGSTANAGSAAPTPFNVTHPHLGIHFIVKL